MERQAEGMRCFCGQPAWLPATCMKEGGLPTSPPSLWISATPGSTTGELKNHLAELSAPRTV